MKILLSAYACDPTRGGEFNNGWNYAYNASEEREIWCVTTTEGKENITLRLIEEPIPALHMIYVEVPEWLYKLKIKSPQIGVYFHYLYWQYKAFKVARGLDQLINFDLVHHATYASLQLGSFMWKLKKPFLFGPVGGGQVAPKEFKKYFYHWWKLEILRDAIGYILLNVLNAPTKSLQHADITLVVNRDTYKLARRYGAKHITYAPCTLLPDNFGPSELPVRIADKTLKILWVGRLLARKGLRLVLEAIALLDKSIAVKLTIIGDGALSMQLPGWIEELGLTDRVTWVGRQPLNIVKKAYATHDVFIYCSLRESLAAQFFESMSFGLPLIIFDLHGAKTFIPSTVGIKIPVSKPEQTIRTISEAILLMYNSPKKRKDMEQISFDTAKNFTRSGRIEDINRYYSELLKRKRVVHTSDLV